MENSMKQSWRLSIVSFLVVLFLAHDAVSQNLRNNSGTNTSEENLKIIDVHTHGYRNSDWKEAGVVGVVAMPGVGNKIEPYKDKNVITCLVLDDPINLTRVEADLKKGYGCIKIFLGYVHRYPSEYKGVYELAAKYEVPVVFHTGDTQDKKAKLKFADPIHIDEVAVDNPEVTFVIAHCGNPWYQTAAEVAYKNKNVFLECSALLTGDVSKNDPEQVRLLMVDPIKWVFAYVEDPRKVMFGSDYSPSIVTNIKSYLDAYKKAIPPKHWKAVFSENAACVYKFNEKFADFRQVDCDKFWNGLK